MSGRDWLRLRYYELLAWISGCPVELLRPREHAAGDELEHCSNCEMRLGDCTCDWRKRPGAGGE